MLLPQILPVELNELAIYEKYKVQVTVARLDLVHPIVSGNKWFKLHPYLKKASDENKTIVTYGGPYSNHLHATAAACYFNHIRCIGIIRGERPAKLSPTLEDAIGWKMQLHFVSRTAYRLPPESLLPEIDPQTYIMIPEGGYGATGAAGASIIMKEIAVASQFTHIILACGSGTTMAGIVNEASKGQTVVGVSSLKNNHSLEDEIKMLLHPNAEAGFELLHDFHFGGYGKWNLDLIRFMNTWYEQTHIPSDFVYTGKMFSATDQLIKRGHFAAGSRLLLIHTGGLQGNRSLRSGQLIF